MGKRLAWLKAIDGSDLLLVSGVSSLAAGLALWWVPAALIVVGLVLITVGMLSIVRR